MVSRSSGSITFPCRVQSLRFETAYLWCWRLQETPSQNFTSPNTDSSTGKSNDWFGFKLNFESDVDGNEYRDLTVSSPKSEQLFIYKTRPSIETEVTIKTDKEPLPYKLNEKQISKVEICAKYSGKGLPKTMSGSIQIELDVGTSNKRIYKSESKSYVPISDSCPKLATSTKSTVNRPIRWNLIG